MASDEMVCPICGRSNPPSARYCENCGKASALRFRLPTPEQWERVKAEIYPKRGIPLPPQMREKVAPEQITPMQTVEETATLPAQTLENDNCIRCGREFGDPSGVVFSFCARCGADSIGTHRPARIVRQRVRHRSPFLVIRRVVREIVRQSVRAFLISPKRGSRIIALGSFFLPGMGQLLNGQLTKALQIMVAATLLMMLFGFAPFGLLMLTGRALIALDAFRIAERRRVGRMIPEWDFKI